MDEVQHWQGTVYGAVLPNDGDDDASEMSAAGSFVGEGASACSI